MVDVDYYVDMIDHLATHVKPTLLFTIQPENLTGRIGEGGFCFRDDTLECFVSGGATYRHRIWNYGADCITVAKMSACGTRKTIVSYLVERAQAGAHKQLVLLIPIGKWTSWGIFGGTNPAEHLGGQPLERLHVTHRVGNKLINRLRVVGKDGINVATSSNGSFSSALIPVQLDNALADVVASGNTKLTKATMESYLPKTMFPDALERKTAAAVLACYHQNRTATNHEHNIFAACEYIDSYQFSPDEYDPEAKPGVVPFMAPIIHPASAPDLTRPNEERCVKKRITEVATGKLPLTKFLDTAMIDFINELIPDARNASPVDIQTVYDKQDRPSQRNILERASMDGPHIKRVVKCFQKKEAYGSINDPRNISTINGSDKMRYSTYMYALADHVKKQPWYAFSKTPAEVADRVVHAAMWAAFLQISDCSRMDGRLANVARILESRLAYRFFHVDYHEELADLLGSQFNQEAFATFGTRFETLMSRLSGSPETSIYNTLLNAFICYLAFRTMRKLSKFIGHRDAWDAMARGMYGGDDGITPDLPSEAIEKAGDMMGQVITGEVVKRGERGVNFLARVYSPDVWTGCPDSMCDLRRTLGKFHTTTSLSSSVTPGDKLIAKSHALLLTDRNTPIIGPYSRAVVKHGAPRQDIWRDVASWWSRYDLSVQYPNEYGEWMEDELDLALPEADLQKFYRWLYAANTVKDLLNPPSIEPKVLARHKNETVVINGETVPPANDHLFGDFEIDEVFRPDFYFEKEEKSSDPDLEEEKKDEPDSEINEDKGEWIEVKRKRQRKKTAKPVKSEKKKLAMKPVKAERSNRLRNRSSLKR